MGKKKQTNSLGRSIIRDRFGSKGRRLAESYLHTSEVDDGYDWNKLNLRSVTEESSLDDFLATAEMAGTEFTAEKLNIKFVSQEARLGMLSAEEMKKIQQTQDEHRQLLNIPRRPSWNEKMTAVELDIKERESFLEWRRKLAELQEVEGLVLTPFEKNLEFWRQLWRVIERSDIIVQIVDGRNPLLFRSEDLERYVKEIDSNKLNLILLNKADYLTDKQRKMWAAYFDAAGVHIAFWSAVSEMERQKEEAKLMEKLASGDKNEKSDLSESSDGAETSEDKTDDINERNADKREESSSSSSSSLSSSSRLTNQDEASSLPNDSVPVSDVTTSEVDEAGASGEQAENSDLKDCDRCKECDDNKTEHCVRCDQKLEEKPTTHHSPTESNISNQECPLNAAVSKDHSSDGINNAGIINNSRILTGSELIDLFKSLHKGKKYAAGITTIGMVGYPNVGKSSTINALLQTKKVPVSATPGRTKHFQTLYLDKTLMLCDCPGLVMPTFVNTKAEMVISGILPIDQMRDYATPVAAVCRLIPRQMLENIYGIMIPKPREGEDENRPPTPHELLGAYACMRGFMTHKGIPDYQRAARHILKDFVNGKLLYCTPPPDCDLEEFCPTPKTSIATKDRAHPQPQPVGSRPKQMKQRNVTTYTSEMDRKFFEKNEPKMGVRGVRGGILGLSATAQLQPSQSSNCGKPWKKHHNHGRKEKLRRITSHLDA